MPVVFALLVLAKLFFLVPDQTQIVPADVSIDGVYLPATINGHVVYMHLDSGSEGIVIDPAAARAVGMSKDDVADVTIGPVHATAVRFDVLPYGKVVHDKHIVGIIGYQFFRSNPVTIDYPHHRLIVHGSDYDPAGLGTEQPIAPIDGGRSFLVHVWYGGQRATMLLDTGAFHSFLFPEFAKRLRRVDVGPITTEGFGFKEHQNEVYDVADVNFAGILIKRAQVVVPNQDESVNAQYDGILGRDILSQVIITIDESNDSIYVKLP